MFNRYKKYYRKYRHRIMAYRSRRYKTDKEYRRKILIRALRFGLLKRFEESVLNLKKEVKNEKR